MKVVYEQSLSRQVEVEITDEELAVLRNVDTTIEEESKVRDRIINAAIQIMEEQRIEPVFVMGTCYDPEEGDEFFNIA